MKWTTFLFEDTKCLDDDYLCKNPVDGCIPIDYVCDYERDCINGHDDEMNCIGE